MVPAKQPRRQAETRGWGRDGVGRAFYHRKRKGVASGGGCIAVLVTCTKRFLISCRFANKHGGGNSCCANCATPHSAFPDVPTPWKAGAREGMAGVRGSLLVPCWLLAPKVGRVGGWSVFALFSCCSISQGAPRTQFEERAQT